MPECDGRLYELPSSQAAKRLQRKGSALLVGVAAFLKSSGGPVRQDRAPRLPSSPLNNLATEVGGFRYSRGFSPRGCPRFAVTPTTKSLLTQPLYGKGRNPPPSEPPELALGDPFSGLNDYDTGVKPGCCSGWNGLTDPFRGLGFFFKICYNMFRQVAAWRSIRRSSSSSPFSRTRFAFRTDE